MQEGFGGFGKAKASCSPITWRFRVLRNRFSKCRYNPHKSPLSTVLGFYLGYRYSYGWVTKCHEPPRISGLGLGCRAEPKCAPKDPSYGFTWPQVPMKLPVGYGP